MAREVDSLGVQGVVKAAAKGVVPVVGPVLEAVAGPVAAKAGARAANRAKGASLDALEAGREATKAGRAGRAAVLRSRVLARPPSTPSAPARTSMAARRAAGGPRAGSRTITTRNVSSFSPWTKGDDPPFPLCLGLSGKTFFLLCSGARYRIGTEEWSFIIFWLHTRSRRAAMQSGSYRR